MQTKGMSRFMCIAERQRWNVNTGLTGNISALKKRLLTTCHQGIQGRSGRLSVSILSILNSNGMNSSGGANNEKTSSNWWLEV